MPFETGFSANLTDDGFGFGEVQLGVNFRCEARGVPQDRSNGLDIINPAESRCRVVAKLVGRPDGYLACFTSFVNHSAVTGHGIAISRFSPTVRFGRAGTLAGCQFCLTIGSPGFASFPLSGYRRKQIALTVVSHE